MEQSGARIVLLDNDARIVELVEWFLGTRGYRVRTAASFAELRARLDEGPCDLLISDLDLGAESALTELPRLAAERALPPTLVVSGFLDATNQRSVLEVPGVVGTLPKPFEFEDLEARVRVCLDGATAGDAPPGPAPHGAAGPPPGPAPDPGDDALDPGDDDDGWVEITG